MICPGAHEKVYQGLSKLGYFIFLSAVVDPRPGQVKNRYGISGLFFIIFSILAHAKKDIGQTCYFPFIFSHSLRLGQYLAMYFKGKWGS